MGSGYLQQQLGGGRVRFTITPAAVPAARAAPLVLAGAVALLVLGATFRQAHAVMIAIRLAIAAGGAVWVHRGTSRWLTKRIDRLRSPGGRFVVSPAAIETPGGTSIPRDQLGRLFLGNGVSSTVDSDAGGHRAAGRPNAAAVSFMLCAEHCGRSSILAGGMTADTARGLKSDVSRILRLDERAQAGAAPSTVTADESLVAAASPGDAARPGRDRPQGTGG